MDTASFLCLLYIYGHHFLYPFHTLPLLGSSAFRASLLRPDHPRARSLAHSVRWYRPMAAHSGPNKHAVAPMEVSVEAGNAGAAEWLDDDGRPCRKGTFWTASAHIITAVIGSGVLSLAWAIAQLGWVAGPAAMLLFEIGRAHV